MLSELRNGTLRVLIDSEPLQKALDDLIALAAELPYLTPEIEAALLGVFQGPLPLRQEIVEMRSGTAVIRIFANARFWTVFDKVKAFHSSTEVAHARCLQQQVDALHHEIHTLKRDTENDARRARFLVTPDGAKTGGV